MLFKSNIEGASRFNEAENEYKNQQEMLFGSFGSPMKSSNKKILIGSQLANCTPQTFASHFRLMAREINKNKDISDNSNSNWDCRSLTSSPGFKLPGLKRSGLEVLFSDKKHFKPFITHRGAGPLRKSALTVAHTPTALGLALTPAESVDDEEKTQSKHEQSEEKSSQALDDLRVNSCHRLKVDMIPQTKDLDKNCLSNRNISGRDSAPTSPKSPSPRKTRDLKRSSLN